MSFTLAWRKKQTNKNFICLSVVTVQSQDPLRPILMRGVTTEDSSFYFVRLLHFTWESKIKWRRILFCTFPFRFLNFIYGSLKTGLFEVWVSMNESLWRLSGFNYLMGKAPRHFSFFLISSYSDKIGILNPISKTLEMNK